MSYAWACTAMDGLSPCFADATYLPTLEGALYSFNPAKVIRRCCWCTDAALISQGGYCCQELLIQCTHPIASPGVAVCRWLLIRPT
jgi:hypothetical protein